MELMIFPARQAIQIKTDSLSLVPSKTARNLGVIIDDQLTFTAHIASVSRSCRFALYNIHKLRPYLTQYPTQLLVQPLVSSRLDYCNALLTGLPACVVKPLQMIHGTLSRTTATQAMVYSHCCRLVDATGASEHGLPDSLTVFTPRLLGF